jgi:hypothetical protein
VQEVNVRVWDNAECATNYKKLSRDVIPTMLCAGEMGGDACQVSISSIDILFKLAVYFSLLLDK